MEFAPNSLENSTVRARLSIETRILKHLRSPPLQSFFCFFLEVSGIMPIFAEENKNNIYNIEIIIMAVTTQVSHTPQMIVPLEDKARKEYTNGETISCSTPEEMLQYFDSL